MGFLCMMTLFGLGLVLVGRGYGKDAGSFPIWDWVGDVRVMQG